MRRFVNVNPSFTAVPVVNFRLALTRFADIACVRTRRGWPCPALAMNTWPGRAVGWPMPDRMGAGLADEVLKTAIARRRPPAGCTRHSDHGSRHVSLRLGRTMGEDGIGPSMGAISPPWDNAAMESPTGLVRAECVHARTFESRERAAPEIFEYTECLYDRVRTHSALGCLSPEEFEARNREGAAKAA